MMKVMKAITRSTSCGCYHHATGTVLAGENLAWQYPQAKR